MFDCYEMSLEIKIQLNLIVMNLDLVTWKYVEFNEVYCFL